MNTGVLSDFYKINLNDQIEEFVWEKITEKERGDSNHSTTPGPIFRHSAITYQDAMYIYGGQQNSTENTDKLYKFDYNTEEFQLVQPTSTPNPPPLDSYTLDLWKKDDKNSTMIMIGGFIGGKMGQYTQAVWEFNFSTSSWSELYAHNLTVNDKTHPCGRMGHALAIINSTAYVFGGTDSDARFNDMWEFDLVQKKWSPIALNDPIPEPRNGHTLTTFENTLVLFGGIHDITHEKNDVFLFNIEFKNWSLAEGETVISKSIQNDGKKGSVSKLSTLKKKETHAESIKIDLKISSQNCSEDESVSSPRGTPKGSQMSPRTSPASKGKKIESNFRKFKPESQSVKTLDIKVSFKPEQSILEPSTHRHASHGLLSPSHQKLQRKEKDFLLKKMMMLSAFEVPEEDKAKFRGHSPTTQAMRSSIENLGTVLSNMKDTAHGEFNKKTTTHSKSEYFDNISVRFAQGSHNRISGQKPCARDGHSAALCGSKLIIFGGDRHHMCFNDLYALNLQSLINK